MMCDGEINSVKCDAPGSAVVKCDAPGSVMCRRCANCHIRCEPPGTSHIRCEPPVTSHIRCEPPGTSHIRCEPPGTSHIRCDVPTVDALLPVIADLQYQLALYKESMAQQMLQLAHNAEESTLRMLHVLEEVSLYKSHTQRNVEGLERRVGYLEKQLLTMSFTLENLSYTVRDRATRLVYI